MAGHTHHSYTIHSFDGTPAYDCPWWWPDKATPELLAQESLKAFAGRGSYTMRTETINEPCHHNP